MDECHGMKDDEENEEDDQLCGKCRGSGEGQHDGTKCTHCGGGGIEPSGCEDDE